VGLSQLKAVYEVKMRIVKDKSLARYMKLAKAMEISQDYGVYLQRLCYRKLYEYGINNPWLGVVVAKMTLLSPVESQIAFWRLHKNR
jgi:hypothetical protein